MIPPNEFENPAIHGKQPVGLKVKQYAGLAARRFQRRISGVAVLESLERPWLKTISSGDPEHVATVMRLLLVHLAVTSKRLVQASVLDRLDKNCLRGSRWIRKWTRDPKRDHFYPFGGHPRDLPDSLNPVIALKTQSKNVNFSAH